MIKIKIVHDESATVVTPLIVFYHPSGQLKDFDEVEIIPINNEGKQILKSEIKKVVEIGQPNEKGISQYEAGNHIKP
ncbi:hypothetical protein [Sphingobacterium anhuiense]|uniref:hypothetical protein n=1 Tax=Sphingobacterium anhuiense TaxID=493780 RepID=UPI003C2D2D77